MNKVKNIYSKLIEVVNQISKNKTRETADWIFFDVPKKYRILKIKEWLKEKKKPKGLWTKELAEDLAKFHSIDAELELTKILSEEIAKEVENGKRKKNI